MGLGLKLLLAALSGFLVSLTWVGFSDADSVLGQIAFYGVSGGLFAAGVLLPYLERDALPGWRPVALVVVSSTSFYCAVFAAIEWSSAGWSGPGSEDYVVGSTVGAAIVFLAAPFLLPLRFSVTYAVAGILAAVGGGLAFGAFEDLFDYSFFFSFGSWHALMCVALHVAHPSAAADGWLAGVSRARLGLVVGMASLCIVVPLADDGMGAFLRHLHFAQDGGMKTRESVEAHGFLDRRGKRIVGTDCGFGCISPVLDGDYAFQEYRVDDAGGPYLVFFMADRPDPNCHRYDESWNPPLKPTWQTKVISDEGRCLTYRLSGTPAARYALRDDRQAVAAGFGLYSLRKTTRQVVRAADGAVLAEAVYYEYESRFFGDTFGTVEPWSAFLERALPAAPGEWRPPVAPAP